ncbi:hypothetical protein SAY86_008095 [Trapa natans]|uniref:Protein MIZU-KUSSEI 1 n=1 Tax=Trapa natans TaxID=22666 RepID=A0AAN7K9K4_TRANT|nr:hypothetical protein SAY86_008095 [Trapa natans]
MKSIISRSPHGSFSFSRRFNWPKKVVEDEDDYNDHDEILRSVKQQEDQTEEFDIPDSLSRNTDNKKNTNNNKKKALPQMAMSKLRSALTSLGRSGGVHNHSGRVVGTLFGYRRGHVQFAVQSDPRGGPEFLIQLAAPTYVLVREMASGIVRIALECDKKVAAKKGRAAAAAAGKLLEEPIWRAYCNGRKCGYGLRQECGAEEVRVLAALEPISMGAGVIPAPGGNGGGEKATEQGELMYMRARFERIVGSRDSETFYMMNLDGNGGGPELSFYLMRV